MEEYKGFNIYEEDYGFVMPIGDWSNYLSKEEVERLELEKNIVWGSDINWRNDIEKNIVKLLQHYRITIYDGKLAIVSPIKSVLKEFTDKFLDILGIILSEWLLR